MARDERGPARRLLASASPGGYDPRTADWIDERGVFGVGLDRRAGMRPVYVARGADGAEYELEIGEVVPGGALARHPAASGDLRPLLEYAHRVLGMFGLPRPGAPGTLLYEPDPSGLPQLAWRVGEAQALCPANRTLLSELEVEHVVAQLARSKWPRSGPQPWEVPLAYRLVALAQESAAEHAAGSVRPEVWFSFGRQFGALLSEWRLRCLNGGRLEAWDLGRARADGKNSQIGAEREGINRARLILIAAEMSRRPLPPVGRLKPSYIEDIRQTVAHRKVPCGYCLCTGLVAQRECPVCGGEQVVALEQATRGPRGLGQAWWCDQINAARHYLKRDTSRFSRLVQKVAAELARIVGQIHASDETPDEFRESVLRLTARVEKSGLT